MWKTFVENPLIVENVENFSTAFVEKWCGKGKMWKTLWKMWKSFPQKLWKSGGVESFGENSVENPGKFSTLVVENFVD